MKLTKKTGRVLLRLLEGEVIPASSAKSSLIEQLVLENILFRKGKHKKTIELRDAVGLHNFLAIQLQVHNLSEYLSILEKPDASRAEYVRIATDSKRSKERAFKGFLVNSYFPIVGELNQKKLIIHPPRGSFTFIYDFETFKVPEEITIVGIENSKNFSNISHQKYLFQNIIPLFVSRYPQNQNKDFIRWMKAIPNKYLHFGDFDLAGVGIYLNEYKRKLGEKASFFIPPTLSEDLKKNGNRERFDNQRISFDTGKISETEIVRLIELINKEKKGLDQEFYIQEDGLS